MRQFFVEVRATKRGFRRATQNALNREEKAALKRRRRIRRRKKALERWLKAPLQPANERKVLSRKWLELFFTSSKKAQIESSWEILEARQCDKIGQCLKGLGWHIFLKKNGKYYDTFWPIWKVPLSEFKLKWLLLYWKLCSFYSVIWSHWNSILIWSCRCLS